MKEDEMGIGEIIPVGGDIETFPNRRRIKLKVKNTGDRGIQVGSHFHFFEVNRALEFDSYEGVWNEVGPPIG